MYVKRKYGVATQVYVPLVDGGAQDFEATPVTFDHTSVGDVQVSVDGATYGVIDDTTANPSHIGNGVYKIELSATELTGKTTIITLIDQTATKEWEDQAIVIDTYGHASAEHPYMAVAESPERAVAFSDLPIVMRSSSDHITPTTGLTVAGTVSKDGAAFGAIAGSIAEVGNGTYQADLTAADMTADLLILRFTASGADDTFVTIKTS